LGEDEVDRRPPGGPPRANMPGFSRQTRRKGECRWCGKPFIGVRSRAYCPNSNCAELASRAAARIREAKKLEEKRARRLGNALALKKAPILKSLNELMEAGDESTD